MRLTNNEVAKLVYSAFEETFNKKNNGNLKGNPSFRSSYFVSKIGKKLRTHFEGAQTHFQAIEDIGKKEKTKGEWLFDICVTSQIEIKDTRHKDGKAKINTNILFACESEFETSLSAFATDFGKLICSNANQILYVQGVNQKTEDGRKQFIENRKEIIKTQLFHLIRDDFVLAFIPTPGKVGNGSFWDEHEKDVKSWASIWIYSASENKFIKYK